MSAMNEPWAEPEEERDDYCGMGAVVWIVVACTVLGVVLFLAIPW